MLHTIMVVVLSLTTAALTGTAQCRDDDSVCQEEQRELDMSVNFVQLHKFPEHSHDTDTALSMRDSLGFIAEPEQAWLMRKQIHRDQIKHEILAPNDCLTPCPEGYGHIWFQEHHEPSFHCEFAERIGVMGDGGKWVCDPERIRTAVRSGQEKCLVYSVGSNGDFSFEQSVLDQISYDCEIHTFDPEKKDTWKPPTGVQYHSVALGNASADNTTKPLAQIVKDLGHVGRKIDLFKIDCEGCEWDTFKSWFGSGVDLRQILVELHWHSGANLGLFEFLRDQGYVIFNKEPNTLGCQGECIEYAFLKMSPSFSILHNQTVREELGI